MAQEPANQVGVWPFKFLHIVTSAIAGRRAKHSCNLDAETTLSIVKSRRGTFQYVEFCSTLRPIASAPPATAVAHRFQRGYSSGHVVFGTGPRLDGIPARCGRLRTLAIRFWRQAGDADSGVAFVADVEADQQCGDLLNGASIFQFAAVDSADSGNFRG